MPADGALEITPDVLQEGSLPRLHFRGKAFVENHHQAGPFHELLPVRETGLSEKTSLRDNLIVHSENTSIHESLVICRRRPKDDRPATVFVSLHEMPASAEDEATADAVSAGPADDWGRVCPWPANRVRVGDWTPVQWYDGALAEALFHLEEHALAIDTEGSVVADWRRRLAAEPTITNARAPDSAIDPPVGSS